MNSDRIVGISAVIDENKISRFQLGVMLLCAAIGLVEGFDTTGASYVAPALAKAWSLDRGAMGLFFSTGLFGLMLGALFIAPLADRVGRKPILVACPLIFGVGCLCMSASHSIGMLKVAWFFTGLGIGGAMPNSIAMVAEYMPRRSRALMVVLTFNGFNVGSIIAGLIAAPLIHASGWPAVFVVGGGLPLLLSPVLFLALPESVRFLGAQTTRQDLVSRLLRKIDPSLPDAGVSYVIDETAVKVSVRSLFQDGRARNTLLLWALVFCSLLDVFLMSSWLPTQIASLGVSVGIAIAMGALLQVGGLIGSVLGWALDRIGPSRTLAAGYVLGAACIACIAQAGGNVPLLALSVFGAGFGVLGAQSAANAVAAIAYPTEIRSTGVGWYFGVGRVGSIVGPLVAGVLLAAGVSHRNVFFLAVIPALAAAAAAFNLRLPLKPPGALSASLQS